MDTDYNGTFSRVPSRRDESAGKTARERRGKYKANRREPRTRGRAHVSLIHSELPPDLCISYTVDADGNRQNVKPFKSSKARTRTPSVAEAVQATLPEVTRFNLPSLVEVWDA